ncbi:MAG: hypothetical protein V4539_06935 [Bacteroidota bacterium]
MIYKLSLAVLLSMSIAAHSPNTADGNSVLKIMYKQYGGKWLKTFTFTQTTERYRNDSLQSTQTWYEAASYPDKFRIDFGSVDSGNAVIYKGDSSYNFRKGKLLRTRKDANDLTFLLGGMYFYTYDGAAAKMKELGYDLSRSFETTWKGKPVYVIGANVDGEKLNQLWIDKDKLVVVRFFKYENGRKEEGVLDDHIKAGVGWTETKASFYLDDKLIQKEFYHDFKTNPVLDDRLFEPADFGKWHWYKN